MDVLEIIGLENGPYIVTYKRTENEKKIALCRCGASQHKPLCDGEHKNCNFIAEEELIKGDE